MSLNENVLRESISAYVADAPPTPPDLIPNVVRRVRRRRLAAASASAAAVLVAAVAVVPQLLPDSHDRVEVTQDGGEPTNPLDGTATARRWELSKASPDSAVITIHVGDNECDTYTEEVEETATSVTITRWARRKDPDQRHCPLSLREHTVDVKLQQPVGERAIYDGATDPPELRRAASG